MIANFQKFNEHRYQHLIYFFWQDHNGMEIDLLLKNANGYEVYEVKSTQTLSGPLFKIYSKPLNWWPHKGAIPS